MLEGMMRKSKRLRHLLFFLYNSLRHRGIAMFSAYALLQAVWFSLITPLTIVIRDQLMAWYGISGVANDQLLGFYLSPAGFVLTTWLVAMTLFAFFMQQGVICILLAQHEVSRRSVSQALNLILSRAWLIARIAAVQSALVIGGFVGLLFVGRLLFGWFLAEWDINYYISFERSQVWLYFGTIILLMMPAAIWLLRRWLGWWLAIPIGVLQAIPLRQVLAKSTQLNTGNLKLVFLVNVAWLSLRILVFFIIASSWLWFLKLFLGWWLPAEFADATLILPVALMLLGVLLLSFFDSWLYSSLQYYYFSLARKRKAAKLIEIHSETLTVTKGMNAPLRWLFLFVIVISVAQLAKDTSQYIQRFNTPNELSVMGHRAGGWLALENSLEGLDKAIELGLSSTEIDIQLTRDQRIVVIHDRDLQRLANSGLVISESTLQQLQQAYADAGLSALRPLEDWLQYSLGKIRLNIELKRYNLSNALVDRLLNLLENYPQRVILSSLDHELLAYLIEQMELRGLRDHHDLALIKAASIGSSVLKEDVDMLVVSQHWVSPLRLLAAQQRGQKVYVWTINQSSEIARLHYLGVDGVITDNLEMAMLTKTQLEQETELDLMLNRINAWLSFGRSP